jgi:hypothetical protein
LDAVGEPVGEILDEARGVNLIALAHQPGRDQLAVGADAGPRPHVAVAVLALMLFRDVSLLGVDERPDLVTLHALARQVAERRVLVLGARPAEVHQQLDHGVLGRAGHADGGADRVALDQAGNDAGSFLGAQSVHTDYHT